MLFFQHQPKGEEMMRTANMSGPLVQLGGVTYVNMTYDGPDAYNGPEVRNAARPGLPRNRSMHIIVRDPTAIKAHEARMQRAATAAVGDVSSASGDVPRKKHGRRFSLGRKSGKKTSDKDRFKAMEREMDVLIAARF
ncbi:uncharacterized protein SCHCODRAFT_02569941 [Schizophyllum commune H4-8]|nr:uncharacterized protein SCHCODRAFT_02569941 [Schizophyllum commune H4-8]KAI5896839.1 hypothetical protein SCHCODRAFT_02569941 [Schizophyllum commune H4-8]